MEYFPLGDLQQHMNNTGPMAEEDVRVIVYQVLEGLDYMHREGFAHRDVKPGVRAFASLSLSLAQRFSQTP